MKRAIKIAAVLTLISFGGLTMDCEYSGGSLPSSGEIRQSAVSPVVWPLLANIAEPREIAPPHGLLR